MIKKYPTEFCLKYLVPPNIRRDNIKYTKYLHMLLNKMNNKKVEYYMYYSTFIYIITSL